MTTITMESPLPSKTTTCSSSRREKDYCRPKQYQKKKKTPKKDLHSCHVSPLPINITKHELVKLFREYEDLRDVFISQRVEKADKFTFGFVRFKTKKSADHAVQCVSRRANGIPIVVSHSRNIIVSQKDDSDSKQDKPEFDKYFANAFKETWESFDDSKKPALDSILKSVRAKRTDNFNSEPPSCAFSVDITTTTTENIDYKFWRTFFREQNAISKSLMEISRTVESPDTKNLSKCVSTSSKSSTKEKDAELEEVSFNTKEISHSTPLSQLEKEDEGLGSFRMPEPESPVIVEPSYEPWTRKPNCSNRLKFSTIDCNDDNNDNGYSSKDPTLESFEDPRKDVTIVVDQKRHERNLPLKNSYPMGRGKGLALACPNTVSPIQFYRNLRNSDHRLSVKNTDPKKADIVESQFPNRRNISQVPNVYLDSRSSYNSKATVVATKSSIQKCSDLEKFADLDVDSFDFPWNRHSHIPATYGGPNSNQDSFDFRQIRTELDLSI